MAWTNIPATGTVSYESAGGTWSFDPLHRSKMTCEFVKDDAGRTIVGTKHTLRVTAYIQGNSGTDTDLATMKKALSAAGGILKYRNKGFGDLTVNDSSGPQDSAWGPIPRVLSFMPIGAGNAALVEWECDFMIPTCCDSPAFEFALMAANYSFEVDIDADGMSTVTIVGYLEIPMTRSSPTARSLTDVADRYYERIVPQIPAGFRPTQRRRVVSLDKRRLDFTFAFEELPSSGGLPVDCTSATGSHSVRASANNSALWIARLSASYVVEQGKNKKLAFAAFQALILDRIKKSNQLSDLQGSAVFVSFSFEDGLYQDSRKTSFSFEYSFACSLAKIMTASGLWSPVPNTEGTRWRTSVSKALSARGIAGIALSAQDDLIVDLCGGQAKTKPPPPPPPPPPDPIKDKILVACPNPEQSWIDYQCLVEVELVDSGIARHKPLSATLDAAPNLGGAPIRISNGTPDNGSGGNDSILYPPLPAGKDVGKMETVRNAGVKRVGIMTTTQAPRDIFQLRTTPTFRVALVGYALRACYGVPIPSLDDFLGEPTIPGEQIIERRTIARVGGVPLRYAGWRLNYEVAGVPEGYVLDPANPSLRTLG